MKTHSAEEGFDFTLPGTFFHTPIPVVFSQRSTGEVPNSAVDGRAQVLPAICETQLPEAQALFSQQTSPFAIEAGSTQAPLPHAPEVQALSVQQHSLSTAHGMFGESIGWRALAAPKKRRRIFFMSELGKSQKCCDPLQFVVFVVVDPPIVCDLCLLLILYCVLFPGGII